MILDIALLVILILGALIGYKKGLVKIVLKLVGFILSLVLAYIFCSPLANFLYEDMGLGTKISSSIEESISGYIESKTESIKEDVKKEVSDKTSEKNSDYIQNIENLLTKSEKAELGKQEVKENTVQKISEKITMYILKAAAFIIIIILVNICIAILTIIFDGVAKLPVIKTFNEAGGAIASFVLTLLKVWIVLGIISLTAPLEVMIKVIDAIKVSTVVNYLYNNNILMDIILKSLTK